MGKNVLIVDDEKVVRITLTDILEKEGYDVESVDRGRLALERIANKEYNVVLLDVILPDMNGIEILGEIKRKSPASHVIIITGFGVIEDAVRAVKFGAYDYICKPFKKDEIQSIVKRAFEESKFTEKTKKNLPVDSGIEIFKKMVEYGSHGLCITTSSPKMLMEEDLHSVEVVQLNKLEEIMEKANEFSIANTSGVLLLHGFDKLLKEFPADKLKDFIFELSDVLASNDGRLVIGYDENIVNSKLFETFAHEVSEAHPQSIFNVLSSPIRRNLIMYLDANGKSTFTKIWHALEIENAPNLSFHLRNLKSVGLIEEDMEKRYFLTDHGHETCDLVKRFEASGVKNFKNMIWARDT